MDAERTQKHLEALLGRGDRNGAGELVPLVTRWSELLAAIPGLERRRPASHCRISGLSGGVLSVEADHPAWMQLLHWHERELVARIRAQFPVLNVQAVQFRLIRAGETVERPTVVMPEPVKPKLEPDEQKRLESLVAELEGLIRAKRG